ncbi:sensor domain-containing diguanylate cyclase [Pseudomonas jilinensis]|nr:GGDEF domain-containing protein [Pseudomonas jilinensis]
MTSMDPNQAKFQALRLQRFYMAQLNYLITYTVICAAWLADQYQASAPMLAVHIGLGVATQLGFYWLIRSGRNLRYRDPSLTSGQIIVATLLLTYLLAYLGSFRGSLIMVYPIILMFGVFQLSRREFLSHSLLALTGYGSLIAYDYIYNPGTQDLPLTLLQWFVLACILGWLSMFCSYIRELRERLQRRHYTLQAHQETLKGMMGQLQNLATTDALTGLANRRYFIDETRRRMALLGPRQQLGLALIDLDHFKRINDLYGHAVGDEVLQRFAQLARDKLRSDDVIARFGGEEFIILLSNCDLETLHQCVERIRQAFAKLQFSGLPEDYSCTLSAGLSVVRPEDDLEERINQADQALYQAKQGGRNRCTTHQAAYA